MISKKILMTSIVAVSVFAVSALMIFAVLPGQEQAVTSPNDKNVSAAVPADTEETGEQVAAGQSSNAAIAEETVIPVQSAPAKPKEQAQQEKKSVEATVPKNEAVAAVEAAASTDLPPSTYQPVQPVVVAEVPAVTSDTTTPPDKPVKKKKTTTTQGS